MWPMINSVLDLYGIKVLIYPSAANPELLSPRDPCSSEGGASSSSDEPALDDSSSLSASIHSLGLELKNTPLVPVNEKLLIPSPPLANIHLYSLHSDGPHPTGWVSGTLWASSSPSLPSLHRFILVSRVIWRQPVYTTSSSSHRP